MSFVPRWKHVNYRGGFVKFLNMLVQTLKCLSHTLLGQVLLRKLKHWVYLSAKFSKRVSGPKSRHGKNSKLRDNSRNNHFSINICALSRGRSKPVLETCTVRLGKFSISSTEILWNKIENYNKAWSACIVIEILWIKLKPNPLHIS